MDDIKSKQSKMVDKIIGKKDKRKILLIIAIVFSVILITGVIVSVATTYHKDRAAIYLNIVMLHANRGELTEAVKEAQKIIKTYPKYDLAYSVLADIYYKMGDLENCLDNQKKAAEMSNNPEYYFDIAETYYYINNLNEAINYYKKVIELSPNDLGVSNAYLGMGNAYFDMDNLQESKNYYDKALGANYNNANAHNDLGLYYEAIGNITKAKDEYSKALQINPNHSRAEANLDRLNAASK